MCKICGIERGRQRLEHRLEEPESTDRRWAWAGSAAVFALFLGVSGALFARFPVLYDTDSYYHLAIARAYLRHGIIDSLPWAQLSLLHEFGDKELLFHLLLAPFSDTASATAGGRLALAIWNALAAATLAFLGFRAVGRVGLLVPVLIYAGSLDFVGRMIRLRPEILSLLLLLAAVACAARRRYRALAVVAFLYTLGYTAFHALLGLCGLWFAQQLWARGRREWGLLLYPILGAGLALVLHPHFPQNLVVWKVQSLDFFAAKNLLNVGGEINPQSTRDLLFDNLGWWLALAVLWRAQIQRRAQREDAMADFLWITTAVFGVLFFAMQRFSIYFVPFATLALLYELRRRGAVLGGRIALPWRGHLPLAVGLVAAVALGLPGTAELLGRLSKDRVDLTREQEWSAFGRALPPGARVAAEWGSTHLYMFWAPQATFLNVLDPVFMTVRYPRAYEALRAIFDGREPDVPGTLRRELRSDYVALSRYSSPPRLSHRLAADPRLEEVHRAYTQLYRLVPGASSRFVLDWRVIPEGHAIPLPQGVAIDGFPAYPRPSTPEEREVEGYVDATRLAGDPGDCYALVHTATGSEARRRLLELAPYGPTRIWLDQEPVLSIDDAPAAVLGRGVTFPLDLPEGEHRLTVLTCPGPEDRAGFYLVTR